MRALDKRRFFNAVNHIESEEIAIFEIDPDIMLANNILKTEFPLSLHAFKLSMADFIKLNRRTGNDIIFFSHIWRLGRKEKKDETGRIHYIDGTMKTPRVLRIYGILTYRYLKKSLMNFVNLLRGQVLV